MLHYRKAILVSTGQYENVRLEAEFSDSPKPRETEQECFDRIRAFVNANLVDEVINLKMGPIEDASRKQAAYRDEQRNAIVKKFGL